jgi:hypothetical protein
MHLLAHFKTTINDTEMIVYVAVRKGTYTEFYRAFRPQESFHNLRMFLQACRNFYFFVVAGDW